MRIKVVLAGLALLLMQGISNGAPNTPFAPSRFEVDGYPVEVLAPAGRLVFQRRHDSGLAAGEPWLWPRDGAGTVQEQPRLIVDGGQTWLTFAERRADGAAHSRAVPLTAVFAQGFATAASAWAAPATEAAVHLSLEEPAQDAAVGEASPVLRVVYATPTGLPVDPATLAFTRGGEPLEMRCSPIAGGAECVPSLPFADGRVEIEATVADVAGHLSPVAARDFTVDTAEPWLSLSAPAEGFLIAGSTVRVTGYVSEEVLLTIGGVPVELSPELTFAAEIPLAEGANVLILEATDAAGNSAALVRTGTSDTVPPPPLAADRVAASQEGSRLTLLGAPGAAESHARVRWRNARTLQEVETLAAADGSFETALAGATADLLTAVVVDAFDHTSPPTELAPPEPSSPAAATIADTGLAATATAFLWPPDGTALLAFAETPCLAP